jgi:hypothetical protein
LITFRQLTTAWTDRPISAAITRGGFPSALDSNNVLSEQEHTYRDISQMQGRHNADPESAHLAVLKPFVREARWSGAQDYWPSVTDVDGVEHDVDAIPPGTVLKRLDASWNCDAVLPEDLTVQGNAYFGSRFLKLPERLTVGGDISFSGTKSDPLVVPASVQIGGVIRMFDEDHAILPDHLRAKAVLQKSIVSTLSFTDFANIASRARAYVRQVDTQELRQELEAELAAAPVLTVQRPAQVGFSRTLASMETLAAPRAYSRASALDHLEGFEFTPAREHYIDPRVPDGSRCRGSVPDSHSKGRGAPPGLLRPQRQPLGKSAGGGQEERPRAAEAATEGSRVGSLRPSPGPATSLTIDA